LPFETSKSSLLRRDRTCLPLQTLSIRALRICRLGRRRSPIGQSDPGAQTWFRPV